MSPTARRRTVNRSAAKPVLDLEIVRDQVDEWYAIKRQTAMLSKKLNSDKESLKALVHKYGETDPNEGHVFLDLETPVSDRKILQLKNQRAVSTTTNQEAAQRILKSKQLWSEMVEIVEIVDQDKVWAAYYDNRISDAEMEQIFPKSVTYSFILLDENDKPVS